MPRNMRIPAVCALTAAMLAAGCTGGGDDASPKLTKSAAPSASASPSAPSFAPVASREGDVGGAHLRLDVSALTRTAKATVLTAKLTVLEAPADGTGFNPGIYFQDRGAKGLPARDDLSDVRLFVPETSVIAAPARDASNQLLTSELQPGVELKQGESAGLQVVFGLLPEDVDRADVVWPLIGVVAHVPVVNAASPPPAPAFGSEPGRPADPDALADAALVQMSPRFSEMGGAVRTDQEHSRTRVTLASDLLFSEESAELSTKAQEGIARAAAQIRAAGAGPISIIGHTDDQGSAVIGQQLSERRAKAVAKVIARLLPPSQYPQEVEGRGESDPAVPGTSDAARAANRRVEIVAQRAQTQSAEQESQRPFRSAGPTASGSEGLVIKQSDGSALRVRVAGAARTGTWLRLDVAITAEEPDADGTAVLIDLRDPARRIPDSRLDASGVGAVEGQKVSLPAVRDDIGCTCPNVTFGIDLEPNEERRLPVYVSAPAGEPSSVDVHLPGKLGRLTDVPVTD